MCAGSKQGPAGHHILAVPRFAAKVAVTASIKGSVLRYWSGVTCAG